MTLLESWVFDGFGFPNKGINDIKLAKDLGFTDIVFGVASKNPYDYFGKHISDWDNIIGYAQSVGLKIHIMAYIHRNAKYMKDALQLLEFAARFKPKSILLNIEGPGLRGSATSIQYWEFFCNLSNGLSNTGVGFGLVVIPPFPKMFTYLFNNFGYEGPGRIIFEGYSFWAKDGTRLWSHTHKMYPGNFQDRIVSQFVGYMKKEVKWLDHDQIISSYLIMGLANYDLEIPHNLFLMKKGYMPLNQFENVERCMDSVYRNNIPRIAVWSLDHFRGNSAKKKELRQIFIDINSKIER